METATRTVRQSDQRPRWHYRYKGESGGRHNANACDVIRGRLMRCVDYEPHALLTVRIIAQAVEDVLNPSWEIPKYQYQDAFHFFHDGRLEAHADRVGLEADWIRRLIVEAVGGEVW